MTPGQDVALPEQVCTTPLFRTSELLAHVVILSAMNLSGTVGAGQGADSMSAEAVGQILTNQTVRETFGHCSLAWQLSRIGVPVEPGQSRVPETFRPRAFLDLVLDHQRFQ